MDKDNKGSFAFAILFLIACVTFIVVHVFLWAMHRYPDKVAKYHMFTEGFRGTKPSMFAKFYPVAYLIKVLMFTLVLTALYETSTVTKLTLIVVLQIAYIVYLAAVRPFV